MARRIGVITGSRADYGFLKWLMRAIEDHEALDLVVIVTGMHLENAQGESVSEIIDDGFKIAALVPIHTAEDAESTPTDVFARCVARMGETLKNCDLDIVVVLGDRLEALACSVASYLLSVPIAHIHGGETTDGSQDNGFRDAITQLATWHFPCMDKYEERILGMVRERSNVWNVGALAVESIQHTSVIPRSSVLKLLQIQDVKQLAIATYHPVTLEMDHGKRGLEVMLEALSQREDLFVVFTASNSDQGGAENNRCILKFVEENSNRTSFFPFLGQSTYVNLMRHADFMIGNSSSAFFEAAILELPAINIGSRQQGRHRLDNIIDCPDSTKDIVRAIDRVTLTDRGRGDACTTKCFGDGTTARRIAEILVSVQVQQKNVAEVANFSSEMTRS